MTREERQAVINEMYKSLTKEDKDYVKFEINKWCKECSETHNHLFKEEDLVILKKRTVMYILASNVQCNRRIREGCLNKKDYMYNTILKGIYLRIQKGIESLNQNQITTDL